MRTDHIRGLREAAVELGVDCLAVDDAPFVYRRYVEIDEPGTAEERTQTWYMRDVTDWLRPGRWDRW